MPDHGTRQTYQRDGCRCALCTRANAAYSSYWRRLKRLGKQPLQAKVDAHKTWTLVGRLLTEDFTKADLARAFGLKAPMLQWHPERITLENALKVQKLYRERVAEVRANA